MVDTLARRERHALCDLALVLGEDAPTLCGEWNAKELVVHLLVRENSPTGAAGIVVPQLAGLTDRAMQRMGRRDFGTLVERLRNPGLTLYRLLPVEVAANTIEFFVHHEDLRRAQPKWEPRSLTTSEQDALWRMLRLGGKALSTLVGLPLVITRSDKNGGSVTLTRGADPVVVNGMPSELVLFLFGRKQVRGLEFSGPADAVTKVRNASFGF